LEEADLDPLLSTLSIILSQFYSGFTWEVVIGLIALLILIIMSGLVSGSETAFFSLTPSDIEIIRSGKHPHDEAIVKLREKPKQLLATILISNNFINVAIVILSAYMTSLVFNLEANPLLSFLLQVVLITSVILLFGEIIPKIYANKKPLSVARLMVKPLKFLILFFKPLSSLLVRSTTLIDKRISIKSQNISYSELSEAIEMTVDENVPVQEKMILKGFASFGDKEVKEIMQSRVNVTAVDKKTSFRELLQVVVESGFSRIPVYEESFDHVIGILYIKDLLPYTKLERDMNWLPLVRPALYVPENKKIKDLLQEFRDKKIHLAIVVDEYGGTSGIVTLEDIIEEIVGEISDEFDKDPEQFKYKRLSDNTYLFEAKTPINDLCKILDIDDDFFDEVRGESDSIGGLILEMEEGMPPKGTKVRYKQFEFEVTDVDNRKINKIKIKIEKTKDEK
jgi:gliding motility-associated protein GldE